MSGNEYLESVGGVTFVHPGEIIDSFRDCLLECMQAHVGITVARTIYAEAAHNAGHASLPIAPEDVVARLIAVLYESKKIRMDIECLAYATELYRNVNASGQEAAKRIGVSRQAFNKRVLQLQSMLGLRSSRAQKNPEARKKYSLTNRRNTTYENATTNARP